MALPQTVRVKLSSEAAESISLTPVVVQELPVRELVEHMLGVTGKDEPRIRELLLRGSAGERRLALPLGGLGCQTWKGCASCWRRFRIPILARPFAAENCVRAVLRGGRHAIEIPREAAARKSLFQRRDVLGRPDGGSRRRRRRSTPDTPIATAPTGTCASCHTPRPNGSAPPQSRSKFSTLRDQIRTAAFTQDVRGKHTLAMSHELVRGESCALRRSTASRTAPQ